MIARLLYLALVLVGATARADEDQSNVHAGLRIFAQPAASDALVVITPTVSATIKAARWLDFDVRWDADVVTGATPRTYGPPDVISAATSFREVRHLLGAGATARRGDATVSIGYSYGTESDYRSHLLRAAGSMDFFQHNVIVAGAYSHSFDSICDLAQSTIPLLLRQPLDSSLGCFATTPTLTEESLQVDTAELSLTRTFSRRLIATLVGSYQHLSGFQSSPYRRVWLLGGLYQAQESHPQQRDRAAITARVRYAVAPLRASVGFDLRGYRDTWNVDGLTADASWEQPISKDAMAWRLAFHVRGYVQSRAFFYRDAGEAGSYDKLGPVGGYFTADQELAPLADLLVGARLVHRMFRPAGDRMWRVFTSGEASLAFDYVKIFALTPDPPNAARTNGFASALVLGISATGRF